MAVGDGVAERDDGGCAERGCDVDLGELEPVVDLVGIGEGRRGDGVAVDETRWWSGSLDGWFRASGGASRWKEMARFESGAAAKAMGSETKSAPAGMMTSGDPAKVRARSVVGSMAEVSGASGRAMCAEVKCRGSVPKALERCTRSVVPPAERWTIWRRVASVRSCGGEGVLRLGNLLRRSPGGDPGGRFRLGFCDGQSCAGQVSNSKENCL